MKTKLLLTSALLLVWLAATVLVARASTVEPPDRWACITANVDVHSEDTPAPADWHGQGEVCGYGLRFSGIYSGSLTQWIEEAIVEVARLRKENESLRARLAELVSKK